MEVALRPVDRENFHECVGLKASEGQEGFVAPNVYSIAEAKVYPECVPLAVCHGDEVVGLAVYAPDPAENGWRIHRLMIGAEHQRKGYGRSAMLKLIGLLGEKPGCEEVSLSYEPGNAAAEKLYESLGFRKTGEVVEGEVVARLRLARQRARLAAAPGIRDATEADLPEIVEIYNSTVPGRTATADPEPVTVESRRAWFSEHDPESRPLWVAEVDGEIAGWVGFGPFRKKPAYHATAEISVYVSEEHRRKGVARALLAEAIRRAPGLGLKTLTGGIFAHNGPSMRLFEGFGFERWAYYPRVAELDGVERNLIVMGLRLDGTG